MGLCRTYGGTKEITEMLQMQFEQEKIKDCLLCNRAGSLFKAVEIPAIFWIVDAWWLNFMTTGRACFTTFERVSEVRGWVEFDPMVLLQCVLTGGAPVAFSSLFIERLN